MCHRVTGEADKLPSNPLDWQGPPDFFLVWSGTKTLNAMSMACLRSIFKFNPKSTVRVFSDSLDTAFTKPFQNRNYDLRVERYDLAHLIKSSPAEAWYESDALATSIYRRQNLSNILRLLLLYRYGGIYLDFDIIVTSDLRYTKNTVGVQTASLNGAVMAFEKQHPFVWDCMEDFVLNFNGSLWGNNGPMVITRTFAKTKHTINLMGEWAYYSVPYTRTRAMYQRPVRDDSDTMHVIHDHSLLVHLWNNVAVKLNYTIAPDSVTERIMAPYVIPYPEEHLSLSS